jgi:hypothetical protein
MFTKSTIGLAVILVTAHLDFVKLSIGMSRPISMLSLGAKSDKRKCSNDRRCLITLSEV